MPLVLSRKVGERIVISDRIFIEVVSMGRGGVLLAFNAPEDTPIYREELWKKLREQEPTKA